MDRTLLAAVLWAAATSACGGDESETTPEPCLPPHRVVGERCLAPGQADDGCPAGTLGTPEGSCRPAGMLPEDCAEGFMHVPFAVPADDPLAGAGSCEPVLPAEPCPLGLMAVPGDTECRQVMACGSGPWGDIPVDGSTHHVDQTFTGASDGSSQAPWTTIGEAVAAAPPGGLIAIAAGSYHEDLLIYGKPLRLWGACPSEVEIVGIGDEPAAIIIWSGASGTEVRGLAIRGPGIGLALSGSDDVLLDQLWIHDNAWRGVNAGSNEAATTSCTLRSSLVEGNHGIGVYVGAATVSVESTVVRDTLPNSQGLFGRGIQVQFGQIVAVPGVATVRRSLLERNVEAGVSVMAAQASVETTVVRETQPSVEGLLGRGISFGHAEGPASGNVSACLVADNHDIGLAVSGSLVTVETTVVRGTRGEAQGFWGRGVTVQNDPVTQVSAVATLRGLLVEHNRAFGVVISGSEATVESVVVRATSLSGAGVYGRGINIQPDADTGLPAAATLRGTWVGLNHDAAVLVAGSVAALESCRLVGTQTDGAGLYGDGL
ncbi:MAG: right-handed parallel beta-helix repeat-containing protein, partial [Deltaproteobacteria bacterium]|nr:right-handed parallel beta-helix repeat-containing protein [Deltaproteobacteria bacterium]